VKEDLVLARAREHLEREWRGSYARWVTGHVPPLRLAG
jgi:hypothetical protein